jgi:glutathione S-transferase
MLTFYFAPGSSSMAVHIALHETGAPFEARPMSFATKDMQKPEFRAINPNGKVPTLLVDGRVLTEVAGCLFYLARTYPDANLLPVDDPEAEAQVVSWMSFIASAIHPARQAGIERTREVWQIADTRLGMQHVERPRAIVVRNDWAVGARYSIADIHLFRLYWRTRDALDPKSGDFPNIEAHYQRVMARPAVRKTIEIEEKIGYSLPR